MYRDRPMMCPRCARELEEQKVRSALVRACTACGGVWLDEAQADIVFKRMPGGAALVSAANKAANVSEKQKVATDGVARCPVGGEEMILCEAEGIRIDQCPEHGTWFDAHEVRRIANAETHRERAAHAKSSSSSSSSSSSWWRRNDASTDRKPDAGDWVEAFFDALSELRFPK
jgi:Zn-finger nucleic acid-binding protein